MALVLNEEQRLLKDTAKNFLQANSPVEAFRKLRDDNSELAYDPIVWQQMAAEQGWAGITIPEEFGGLAFGFAGLGAIVEEMGRTLAPSPLFATVVLGASAIEFAGTTAQKESLLGSIAGGELTVALALEEGHHHNPSNITTTVSSDGWKINGNKNFVLDGACADKLIVVARNTANQAINLLLVDKNAEGLSIERTHIMDSRNVAKVAFDNVSAEAVLGDSDADVSGALDKALDRGRAILAAEMLGGALEMFQRTCEYLKEREQFGVKIGSFQALKHRASIMFTELELCKSVVLAVLEAIDEDADNIAELASLAKTRLNDTYQLVTNEATQMHGGIGVTDELDVGLFLKRARVCMQTLGDSRFHRDRYATIKGF